MIDYITKIKEHLARLDPSGSTKAEASPAGLHRVHVTRIVTDGAPTVLDVLDAPNLMHVLNELPTGCPVEEARRGSLWETLHVLASHGLQVAIDYVREHHGDYRERLELADQANAAVRTVENFIDLLKSALGEAGFARVYHADKMQAEVREIANEAVAHAYSAEQLREVLAFHVKYGDKTAQVRAGMEKAFTARHAAWMKDPA